MPPEEEIDLLEYGRVIWRRRKMILGVTLAAAVLAIAVSLAMTNIYRAEVLLAPVGTDENKGGGLAGALGGLSGIASLAGVSLPGGGGTEEALAVLKSRGFIWQFVKDNKLMPVLFAEDWDAEAGRWKDEDPEAHPDMWDAYRLFSDIVQAKQDKKTQLVTLSVDWKDPELAAQWANDLVRRLNAYLRKRAIERSRRNLKYLEQQLRSTVVEEQRKALFELISQEQKKAMLANTQEEFAFRVLDPAAPPDRKFKPKRALIVILSTFVAGFLAVIAAFIQEGIERRRRSEASSATTDPHRA